MAVQGAQVVHRVDHHGDGYVRRFRHAGLDAAPQVLEADLPAMDHEEVRRDPEIDAAPAARGKPAHGGGHGGLNGLPGVEQRGSEEEGLDEGFETDGLAVPERGQAVRDGETPAGRFGLDPARVQAALEVGVAIDQRGGKGRGGLPGATRRSHPSADRRGRHPRCAAP